MSVQMSIKNGIPFERSASVMETEVRYYGHVERADRMDVEWSSDSSVSFNRV